MSDQEKPAGSYERMLDSGMAQKAAKLDSKAPIELAPRCNAKPATNGSYYLNVAQKGKLILPTALWVLLIIAGVTCLTLLAALNKSINTLDTLVEIEQQKEALLLSDHFKQRKLGRELERPLKRPTAKPKKVSRKQERHHEGSQQAQMVPMVEPNRPDEGWILPIEPSWFAMPSWTSLEPIRAPAPAMAPMALRDEMLRRPPGLPDAIIVRDGPLNEPPTGLLRALMDSLAPVLDKLSPKGADSASGLISIEPPESPAAISAKIDNINVHIMPEQEGRPGGVNSMEKSFDELVDRLTGGTRLPPPPRVQHRPHPAGAQAHPPRPMLAPLELAPLPGAAPDSMFVRIATFDQPQAPEHHKHKKFGAPAEELRDSQLLISIGDGREPSKPSGETGRHQLDNTGRPSAAQPPYVQQATSPEFILFNPMEPMKHEARPQHRQRPDHHAVKPGKPAEAPWDLLASEMAESLIEDVFKQSKQANQAGKLDEPQIIIIDDTAPLAAGEQPSVLPAIFKADNLTPPFGLPSLDGAHKSTKKPLSDIFTLLFGTAPDSKLLLGDSKQLQDKPTQSTTKSPKLEPTSASDSASSKAATTDATSGTPLLHSTISSFEPTMSPEAKKEVEAIMSQFSTTESSPSTEELSSKSTEEFLQDFMRPLFTLPQMSDGQKTASTNGTKSSGGSSAGVSSTPTTISRAPSITTPMPPVVNNATSAAHNTTRSSEGSPANSIFSKIIGFFKDQQPGNQAEAPKTIELTPSNTSTAPMNGTRLAREPAKVPLVEVGIPPQELDSLPVINLSPFAEPNRAGEPARAAPSLNVLKSTHVEARNANSSSSTTTSKPNMVIVSKADLAAGATENKSFFQKANDVLERQFLGIKRFLNADKV